MLKSIWDIRQRLVEFAYGFGIFRIKFPPTTQRSGMTPSRKTVMGITVVGPDREGIVATFTNFAFAQGGNIEKINQNVMKGLFGMYLEISFVENVDTEQLDDKIQKLAKDYNMEVTVHHESNTRKNIAVLVTKEPLCLESIIADRESLAGHISLIIGTEETLAPVAEQAGIPFVLVKERNQAEAETRILNLCKKYDVDLIVLARYMRILTPNFVWRYPNRIINIHPSLLPAFPGASAYEQAYERGTKIVGVTAHYVSEDLDQGPIILQESFAVTPDDTLAEIKRRGQQLEAQLLLKAMKMHLVGLLDVRWRKVHVRK